MTSALLIWLAVLGQSPNGEVRTAIQDLATLPAEECVHMRYLTTYAIPLAERPNAQKIANFWCNSLSRRKRTSTPLSVSPSMMRVDLRDYDWTPGGWEILTQEDPYFRVGHIDAQTDAMLRAQTQSSGAILRLDYFISRTSKEPHYSNMLGLPEKLDELKKQFYLQEAEAKSIYLLTGGAVTQSRVALHNRKITRIPSMLGYWYQTQDVDNNLPSQDKNVLANLFDINHVAGEFIWSLPNGLQAYHLANRAGDRQAVVPANVAIDSVTTYRDKQVTNPRSCVVCHAPGLNPVNDVVSKIMRENEANPDKRVISFFTKENQLTAEEFYLGGLDEQLKRDQQVYAAAIKKVNGLTVEANATLYEQLVHRYDEELLNVERAAAELGIPPEDLRTKGQGVLNNVLATTLGGEGMPRDAWEDIFPIVAKTLNYVQGGKQ